MTNRTAFLVVISDCEGTPGDEGYRALFGWRPGNGKTFTSFADHPRQFFNYTQQDGTVVRTSAAGKYQATVTTWDDFIRERGPHDFSPASQDEFALWLIEKCGALADVDAGRLRAAIDKCGGRWASLPSATVPQPRRSYDFCVQSFIRAGGVLDGTRAPRPDVPTGTPLPIPPAPKEPRMGALAALQLFGPILAGLIPQISTILKPESDVAKRNVALAETLVNTITQTAGAPNLQAAVEKMQAEPAVKEAVQKAVVTEPAVMAVLEIGAGGIGGARQSNLALMTSQPDGRWWAALCTPVMIMSIFLCAMLIMILGNVLGMPWGGAFQAWTENTRSNVVFAVITGAIGAITGYWFGTTVASNKKDSIIAAQADAARPTQGA